MKKEDKGRRDFIKKAVYATPVVTSFTLGALAQNCGMMGHMMGMGCSPMGHGMGHMMMGHM